MIAALQETLESRVNDHGIEAKTEYSNKKNISITLFLPLECDASIQKCVSNVEEVRL